MLSFSKKKASFVAFTAILLAVTVIMSAAENVLTAGFPTGIRLGLSNITIMTAVLFINSSAGLLLTVLKSGFVFLTRGFIAGAMSLSGGILAIVVIILLLKKTDCSYVFVSVCAAIAHIIGQLVFAGIMTESRFVFAYAPLLILAAVGSGILTGILLKAVTVIMKKTPDFEETHI
jgi:heptaprenyl diphosphate synthase